MNGLISKKYFLIVSGNRCGSTWLEFMLNALPDVLMEYEMQWTDQYISDLHVSMKNLDMDLVDYLESIDESANIIGSKMVFPPDISVNTEELGKFKDIVNNNIAIIHVGRKYLDSCLSKIRDGGHLRNPNGRQAPKSSCTWLQEDFKEKIFSYSKRMTLEVDDIRSNLEKRYNNDEFMFTLNNGVRSYIYIEYGEINNNLEKLKDFIGSCASQDDVVNVLNNPPTKKLPPIDYTKHIMNMENIIALGQEYEVKRQQLVANNVNG